MSDTPKTGAEASFNWIVRQAWSTATTMPEEFNLHQLFVRDALRELAAVTAERDATCRMLRASQEELERAMRVVEAAKAWSQDCDSDNRQGELWFAVMAWEAGR